MDRRSFWQRPRVLAVIGLAAGVLLATGWLVMWRLGPGAPASAETFNPEPRMDENALIAAHAERPGAAPAPAPAPEVNAVEASAKDEPPVAAQAQPEPAPPAAEKPEPNRFDPSEIAREAGEAIDDAAREIEEAIDGDEDGK